MDCPSDRGSFSLLHIALDLLLFVAMGFGAKRFITYVQAARSTGLNSDCCVRKTRDESCDSS